MSDASTTVPRASKKSRRDSKSRGGCLNCKLRHLKCDETPSGCRRCARINQICPGYVRPVKWSTKYERLGTGSQHADSGFVWFEEKAKHLTAAIAENSEASSPVVEVAQSSRSSSSPQDALTEVGRRLSTTSTEHPRTPSLVLDDMDWHDIAAGLGGPMNHESDVWEARDSACLKGKAGNQNVNNIDTVEVVNTTSAAASLDIASPSGCTDWATDIDWNDTFDWRYPDGRSDQERAGPSSRPHHQTSLGLYTPTEHSSTLLNHYFTSICCINSSFDSASNPFRSIVQRMISESPLIFYCVLSMSAAHLYQFSGNKSLPLEFQTRAISELSESLSERTCSDRTLATVSPTRDPQEPEPKYQVKEALLLGTILVGMTSAWHNLSDSGISHLLGSRQLFKAWISQHGFDTPSRPVHLDLNQRFIVSSMIYWEALSSFIFDQKMEDISYLDCFIDESMFPATQPTPWTGVATPIFACIARIGVLMRKRRTLRKVELFRDGEVVAALLHSELLEEARVCEQQILQFQVPLASLIADTNDCRAPPRHFHGLAHCFRLAAFLELYRAFPELSCSAHHLSGLNQDTSSWLGDPQARLILGLAFRILDILETLLDDSGTLPVQNLLLLIAGSSLALVGSRQDSTNEQDAFNQEVMQRRSFVRSRLLTLYKRVGLRPIRSTAVLIEETWSRMDMLAQSVPQSDYERDIFSDRIHWMDLMSEKGLETILG